MPIDSLALLGGLVPEARAIVSCIILILVLLIGGSVVLWLRRRYKTIGDACEQPSGFGLGKLEKLLETGQISRDEFDLLRKRSLGIETGSADRNSSSSCPRDRDDEEDEGQEVNQE